MTQSSAGAAALVTPLGMIKFANKRRLKAKRSILFYITFSKNYDHRC